MNGVAKGILTAFKNDKQDKLSRTCVPFLRRGKYYACLAQVLVNISDFGVTSKNCRHNLWKFSELDNNNQREQSRTIEFDAEPFLKLGCPVFQSFVTVFWKRR